MACSLHVSKVDPTSLPHVWRVKDLAEEKATIATGHELLNQVLPGGGWPQGSMVEVLQQSAGQHVWQLLLPALATCLQLADGPLVLVGSPYEPFAPSLRARGLDVERVLRVQAGKSSALTWATEQAVRCSQIAAVLAWLPQSRTDELRRLHLAAQQHARLLFVFRDARSRHDASPAPLRLLLEGTEQLEVHVLKRRGPPVMQPVVLPAFSSRLASLLQARRTLRSTEPISNLQGRSHVLDRTAAWA
jgi:protein ImuA